MQGYLLEIAVASLLRGWVEHSPGARQQPLHLDTQSMIFDEAFLVSCTRRLCPRLTDKTVLA